MEAACAQDLLDFMRIEAPAMEHPKVARQKIVLQRLLCPALHEGPQRLRECSRARRHKRQTPDDGDNRKMATVSWYGRLLIISMLLVAAGWELFRLIVAIITLD